MSKAKEEVIEMLKDFPEDKVMYLLDIMRGVKGLYNERKDNSMLSDSQMALKSLKKYKGIISEDIDCKAELARAREEKYENIS